MKIYDYFNFSTGYTYTTKIIFLLRLYTTTNDYIKYYNVVYLAHIYNS